MSCLTNNIPPFGKGGMKFGHLVVPLWRGQGEVFDFIADLMCKEHRLVIAVDGITRDNKLERDNRGDDMLRQADFYVFRFTDEEVLMNIEPPPAPPPAGENEEVAPPTGNKRFKKCPNPSPPFGKGGAKSPYIPLYEDVLTGV